MIIKSEFKYNKEYLHPLIVVEIEYDDTEPLGCLGFLKAFYFNMDSDPTVDDLLNTFQIAKIYIDANVRKDSYGQPEKSNTFRWINQTYSRPPYNIDHLFGTMK